MELVARRGVPWLPTALNAVAFNLAWLVTVLGAAGGHAWPGVVAFFVFAAVQVPASSRPRYDLAAVSVFVVAGFLLDSVWSLAGLAAWAAPWPAAVLAPVWLVALWGSFALTLGHSLAWLRPRRRLASLVGALGGALSYWAGVRFGAVATPLAPWQFGLLVGIAWAIALPLLLGLTAHLMRVWLPAHQR